jgi:hypothetical protein
VDRPSAIVLVIVLRLLGGSIVVILQTVLRKMLSA